MCVVAHCEYNGARMALNAGTKLGPYEIVSPVGAGGMGEVYRARDTRLDRTVAIKVLPDKLRTDPELKARFDREARAISSLQHPHICALFDVGHQDGTSFLVMEYLDGETLANRLLRGALPLDQLVKIGVELADALARAHAQGIVHRDVKPGNIMLTKAGIKLMDFGLARGHGGISDLGIPGTAAGTLTPSTPTMNLSTLASPASPLTQKGMIVGTYQYLAPEVLQGKEADARSDIFAVGCVLYEMATGSRAFDGKTQLSVMSAILEKDPEPISALQPLAPAALEGAVRTCLQKDPDERWQTAVDLRNVLALVSGTTTKAPAVAGARKNLSRWMLPAAVAALLALLAAGGVIGLRRAPTPSPLSADLDLPAGTILDTLNDPVSLSPDGRTLALTLLNTDRVSQLWLRRLDNGQTSAVPGTASAEYPFWSPDGNSIGFFAEGKLRRVNPTTGVVQDVCDAPHGRGGTWNAAGTIVFTPDTYGGLQKVAASGGMPTDLGVPMAANDSLRLPHFLPDGDHFLFLRFPAAGPSHLASFSLASRQVTELLQADAAGQYTTTGHLVFVRGPSLFAQKFDPDKIRLSGEPAVIASGVQLDPARKTAAFSVSRSGLLVYAPGGAVSLKQMQWVDSSGRPSGDVGEPEGYYYWLGLSPDGKLVAVGNQKYELSIVEVATGMRRPFSSPSVEPTSQEFAWSPDGRWLAFTADTPDKRWAIHLKATDGRTESRVLHLCQAEACVATAWSGDGKTIAINESNVAGTDNSLDVVSVETGQTLYHLSKASAGHFSPDGKWLAFLLDEPNKPQAYVTAIPPGKEKWQVSPAGAVALRWPVAGSLLYETAEGKIFGVALSLQHDSVQVGAGELRFGGRTFPGETDWDVSSDGKRAMVTVPAESGATRSLKILQNWNVGLK